MSEIALEVAAELAGMIGLGVPLFVLDIMESEEDTHHMRQVFDLAFPTRMAEAMS